MGDNMTTPYIVSWVVAKANLRLKSLSLSFHGLGMLLYIYSLVKKHVSITVNCRYDRDQDALQNKEVTDDFLNQMVKSWRQKIHFYLL